MSCIILVFYRFSQGSFFYPKLCMWGRFGFLKLLFVCLFCFLNSGAQGQGILTASALNGFRKLPFKVIGVCKLNKCTFVQVVVCLFLWLNVHGRSSIVSTRLYDVTGQRRQPPGLCWKGPPSDKIFILQAKPIWGTNTAFLPNRR
jgi:hypothetical protein